MLLTTIFYEIDEFCKEFESELKRLLIDGGKKTRNKKSSLSMSEVMTISVFFHYSGYKNFKQYYINHVQKHLSTAFSSLVSYNRFVELKQNIAFPLAAFMQIKGLGVCTGKTIIDSCPLAVSHQKRIQSHKTFKGLAQRGKTSVGWFYGFKLHLTINENAEILNFIITPGNIADNNEQVLIKTTKNLFGKYLAIKDILLIQSYLVSYTLMENSL